MVKNASSFSRLDAAREQAPRTGSEWADRFALKKAIAKQIAKRALLFCGLDVRRRLPHRRMFQWLEQYNINTVIDIGANTGDFAVMMHGVLPRATVYAFEPLQECYDRLVANMAGIKSSEAFPFALGDSETRADIRRSSYSPASSFLRFSELLHATFPYTTDCTLQPVQVRRLDTVAREDLKLVDNVLIKIDVQGYEDKVIAGGLDTISRAAVLVVETCFCELYEGQPLFPAIYESLVRLGFSYGGSLEQTTNPVDGRVMWSDSVFVRKQLP